MSLEIRKSSKWWYGVFMVKGQRTVINLGVPITGKRPPKRAMLGDDEFERSRGRAQEAYGKQLKKMSDDRTGQKALRELASEGWFPKATEGRYQLVPTIQGLLRYYREREQSTIIQDAYDSIGACAAATGIPVSTLKHAKRQGCSAFRGSRWRSPRT